MNRQSSKTSGTRQQEDLSDSSSDFELAPPSYIPPNVGSGSGVESPSSGALPKAPLSISLRNLIGSLTSAVEKEIKGHRRGFYDSLQQQSKLREKFQRKLTRERTAKEAALSEISRLRTLCMSSGIDPGPELVLPTVDTPKGPRRPSASQRTLHATKENAGTENFQPGGNNSDDGLLPPAPDLNAENNTSAPAAPTARRSRSLPVRKIDKPVDDVDALLDNVPAQNTLSRFARALSTTRGPSSPFLRNANNSTTQTNPLKRSLPSSMSSSSSKGFAIPDPPAKRRPHPDPRSSTLHASAQQQQQQQQRQKALPVQSRPNNTTTPMAVDAFAADLYDDDDDRIVSQVFAPRRGPHSQRFAAALAQRESQILATLDRPLAKDTLPEEDLLDKEPPPGYSEDPSQSQALSVREEIIRETLAAGSVAPPVDAADFDAILVDDEEDDDKAMMSQAFPSRRRQSGRASSSSSGWTSRRPANSDPTLPPKHPPSSEKRRSGRNKLPTVAAPDQRTITQLMDGIETEMLAAGLDPHHNPAEAQSQHDDTVVDGNDAVDDNDVVDNDDFQVQKHAATSSSRRATSPSTTVTTTATTTGSGTANSTTSAATAVPPLIPKEPTPPPAKTPSMAVPGPQPGSQSEIGSQPVGKAVDLDETAGEEDDVADQHSALILPNDSDSRDGMGGRNSQVGEGGGGSGGDHSQVDQTSEPPLALDTQMPTGDSMETTAHQPSQTSVGTTGAVEETQFTLGGGSATTAGGSPTLGSLGPPPRTPLKPSQKSMDADTMEMDPADQARGKQATTPTHAHTGKSATTPNHAVSESLYDRRASPRASPRRRSTRSSRARFVIDNIAKVPKEDKSKERVAKAKADAAAASSRMPGANLPNFPARTVIRCKEHRHSMYGKSCPHCEEFYKAAAPEGGLIDQKELRQNVSRHRTVLKNDQGKTPPGFWTFSMGTGASKGHSPGPSSFAGSQTQ